MIYAACFMSILVISTKNFLTFKSSVNMSNISVVTLLLCVLLNRLTCLLYSLIVLKNKDIPPDTIETFFYFELPFWMLSMASVILFFEMALFAQFLTQMERT